MFNAGGGSLPLRCTREGNVTHEDQGPGVVDFIRSSDFVSVAAATVEECPSEPESNIIHGLFKRKGGSKVSARDHDGFSRHSPAAIAYHTMLSTLDADGRVNLVDCTWPAGTHIPAHVHPGEDELLVVLSGTLEVRIAERTFGCGQGESIFTPRGTSHEVRTLTATRAIAILTRKSLECPRPV
jgi:quercetin dioxygenase-like cupin family protein